MPTYFLRSIHRAERYVSDVFQVSLFEYCARRAGFTSGDDAIQAFFESDDTALTKVEQTMISVLEVVMYLNMGCGGVVLWLVSPLLKLFFPEMRGDYLLSEAFERWNSLVHVNVMAFVERLPEEDRQPYFDRYHQFQRVQRSRIPQRTDD